MKTKPDDRPISLEELLRLSLWCARLSAPVQGWIRKHAREHRVSQGQLLARRGEIPTAWFGEGALLRGKPRHADYVALRDSRVVLLPLDEFAHLLQEQPMFKDFVYSQINERLHYFMDHVGDVRLMRGPARVANALCGLTHVLNNPLGRVHLPIAQDELAAIAGVSRQRCNRALQHMQAQGWLDIGYGHLTLLAREPLAAMARAG